MPLLNGETLQSSVEPGFMLSVATLNTSTNLDQLRDYINLQGNLVPVLVRLLLGRPDNFCGGSANRLLFNWMATTGAEAVLQTTQLAVEERRTSIRQQPLNPSQSV